MGIVAENGNILVAGTNTLATSCSGGACTCSGVGHMKISDCDANCSDLPDSFVVTISGITVSPYSNFNAAHTVNFVSGTNAWTREFDDYYAVSLYWSSGSFRVSCTITGIGTFNVSFIGVNAIADCTNGSSAKSICDPVNATAWDRSTCNCVFCFPSPCNDAIACTVDHA